MCTLARGSARERTSVRGGLPVSTGLLHVFYLCTVFYASGGGRRFCAPPQPSPPPPVLACARSPGGTSVGSSDYTERRHTGLFSRSTGCTEGKFKCVLATESVRVALLLKLVRAHVGLPDVRTVKEQRGSLCCPRPE